MTRSLTLRLVALSASALPLVAAAHSGAGVPHDHGAASALAAGVVHPLTGLDHLAAMVALGAWSGLTARRAWLAPLAFVTTLLAGALLGLAGVGLPAVEPTIAASVLVLGLLMATGRQLPAAAGMALAAGFALFHGVAHGAELAGTNAAAALAGMVLATALLHTAGIGLGRLLRERDRWLHRVAGAGVAVFGLTLLA